MAIDEEVTTSLDPSCLNRAIRSARVLRDREQVRSESDRSLPTKAPVNATVVARDTNDMATDVLFERGRPRHELET
jgi:hypothetical protein